MSAQQEQRVILCGGTLPNGQVLPALALAPGLVIGWQGSPTIPLNFQDLANSGISQLRAYQQLGIEISWTGNPTAHLVVQGNITGNLATMTPLAWPDGGSISPDLLPPDDSLEVVPQPVAMQSAVINPITLAGAPGSALMTWDLRKLRINFLNLLVTDLESGAGNLSAIVSLMYTT